MSEHEQSPGPQRPPLRRSKDDRVIAGVCGGVARTLGIDPIIVRVLVAAFTLAGGAGLIAYILAWILIPEDDGIAVINADRSRPGKLMLAIVIAALGLAAMSSLFPWSGQNMFGLFLFVLIAVVVWQAFGQDWLRGGSSTDWQSKIADANAKVADATAKVAEAAATAGAAAGAAAGAYKGYTPPQRSVLGRIVWNLLIIVAGGAIALDWSGGTVNVPVVLAIMLAIVGVGLIVSAFAGRARGLIALGLVLSLVAVPTGWQGRTDVGERTWIPGISAETTKYSLGVGDATLDLRSLAPTGVTATSAEVGVGTLIVLVPRDSQVEYRLTTHVGLGKLVLPDTAVRNGGDLSQDVSLGAVGNPAGTIVRIDCTVAIGNLEVRYA